MSQELYLKFEVLSIEYTFTMQSHGFVVRFWYAKNRSLVIVKQI